MTDARPVGGGAAAANEIGGIAVRALPGGALAAGAALVALYAAGAAGAPIPPAVRMAAATLALVFWPGAMLLRHFLVDHEIEWPGQVAFALALGLLPGGLLMLLSYFFRFDPGVGLWLLPALGFLLALTAPVRPEIAPPPRGYLPWVIAFGWALLVAVVLGSLGAPLVNDADSFDHIATVRRIEDTRVVFPTDAFFHDAGTHGADPRKGTYHALLALACRAARVDPVTLWRFLPLLFVPVFVLALATLTFALSRSRMAGVVAAVLFPLIYGGGPGGTELRETVYSTRVGEICALLAAAALVRFVEEGGKRRLTLFWLTAGSALLVHVWYALWFALAFGAYALFTLLVAGSRERVRRFAWSLVGLAVLSLPYLAFRAAQAYGPQNVIHTEPQGLLYLSKSLFTVDPQAIWTWHGPWLLVALAAVPWFWSRRRDSTGAIYLSVVTPAVLLIVLNPLLLPIVQAKLGYLTMRLIWVAPVIPAVALVVTALAETVVRGGRHKAIATAGLAACALLALPPLGQMITLVTQRGTLRRSEFERSPGPWRDLTVFLGTGMPREAVLAADPVTSYSIPAYTGRQVMAFYDQHSSPNDPKGLERILDARSVFSPYVGMAKTVGLLRAYGVDAVVLNERFVKPPATDYWSPTRALAAPTLAKFRARPDLFQPVFESDGAYVFALTDAAKKGPLPAGDPAARPFIASAGDSAHGMAVHVSGPFMLRAADLSTVRPVPSDTLELTTRWSLAGAPPPAGSYAVYVRLDAKDGPRAPVLPDAWDKPWRKLVERVTGERYRLRTAHRPLDGAYGPDEWRPGEVVVDTTRMVVPANLAPGRYEVGVALVRTPHYPNTSLADYLHDKDLFSGPVVGEITIAPHREAVR